MHVQPGLCSAFAFLLAASAYAQGAAGTGAGQSPPNITALGGQRSGAARGTTAGTGGRSLGGALSALALDIGRFPSTSEGLSILIRRPAGAKNWKGPYVMLGPGRVTDKPFLDPWGTEYRYTNTSVPGGQPSYEIRSAGPDLAFSTTDDLVINGY
jgi:type II secretory pathway pseudopilin PulG